MPILPLRLYALAGTLAIALLITIPASGQLKDPASLVSKFGKIEASDFTVSSFGTDTVAGAMKLFDVGKCDFQYNSITGFQYVFERHVRYKILNQHGYDLADLEIPLYKSSDNKSRERVVNLQASTYNLENGKISNSKPDKDAKFSESYNKNYTIQRVTLPNVKDESIIEFKYTIESDFLFNLQSWQFQGSIPTLYSQYTVTIPDFLIYKPNQTGHWPVKMSEQKKVNAHYIPGITSSANRRTYTAENIPALREEPFISALSDYIAKIEFELRATNFPNDMYRDMTGNWPKIIRELDNDENFGKYISNRQFGRSLLPEIVGDTKDTLAIVKTIYNYVKKNVKWNDETRLYTSVTSPRNIFSKKTGNSADINLALLNLLKAAGIDAYPVLLSTRKNGIHPGLPSISKFNNVIAAIIIGENIHFLDACDEDMPFGMVAVQNLSHQGFICNLDANAGEWISLEPSAAAEVTYAYDLNLDENMELSGSLVKQSLGYSGVNSRGHYREQTNQTDYINQIKSNSPGLDILEYEHANLDDIDLPFVEIMKINIQNNVEAAGNMLYFSPLLYERTKENPFKLEKRNFPVDFAYPINEHVRVTINYPKSYTLEKLPKGILYRLPDDSGSFLINLISEENKVLIISKITLKKAIYSSEEYLDLKELFNIVVERQAEQIVFKKN